MNSTAQPLGLRPTKFLHHRRNTHLSAENSFGPAGIIWESPRHSIPHAVPIPASSTWQGSKKTGFTCTRHIGALTFQWHIFCLTGPGRNALGRSYRFMFSLRVMKVNCFSAENLSAAKRKGLMNTGFGGMT